MNVRLPLLLAVLLLSACSKKEDADPPVPQWVIDAHVVFVESDGKTGRPIPAEPMRLWVPYVVGDLYGSPNVGELNPVALAPDLSFTVNLNRKHLLLEKMLVPTEFSQRWMSIEPAGARLARVLPYVLPADNITPLGLPEWLDADTGDRLMLVYLDRPARIQGEVVYEGRSLRFDIDTKEAGYIWIRQPRGSGDYVVVPRPAHLVLGVLPE